jgi:hypothetical protein
VRFHLAQTRALAGEAAVYAPPGDVPRFAALIDELLSDPARRAELGQTGRRLIEERLAWDRQEKAYIGVFERILARPRRRPAEHTPVRQADPVRRPDYEGV